MIRRDGFNSEINKIKIIASHYNNESVSTALSEILNTRDNFELKILMVGHFNAGKSSLINKFIGRDEFLAEDQGETTALAAELRYSQEESAYSYDKNKNKELFVKNKEYSPREYDHVSFYLNSPGLKSIEDFVIVDTPGFDTSIQDHTRALSSYLGYGVGFIMVIDIEKGGIDTQTLNYLYEISQYSKNVVVLINKCDKQIDSEIRRVVDSAMCTLEQNGFDFPVFRISKFDKEIVEKISSIVNGIDAQFEYDKAICNTMKNNVKMIVESLKIVSDKQYLDTFEYDEVIRVQERNKELAQKAFTTKKSHLLENVDNDVEVVIQNVKIALSSKADEAAYAIENGSTEGLQAIIIDAVRPVLLQAVKNFSTEKITEISQSLHINFGKNNKQDEKGLDEIVLDIGTKIQGIIQSGIMIKEKDTQTENNGDKQSKDERGGKSSGGNGLYKLITAALSITTDVVAPWMEVVIILLPEIVAGLKSLFGESNHSKVVKRYESEIIPKVTNSLWSSIKEGFIENIDTMIEIFDTEMNSSLNSIEQLLKDARDKKAQNENEYVSFMSMLEKDIDTLNKILEGK